MSHRAENLIRQRESAMRRISEAETADEAYSTLLEHYKGVVDDLLKFEDEGWILIQGALGEDRKGFSLEDVKKVTKYLERQTKTSGNLLGRGLRLKNNHAFGRGFTFVRKGGEAIQPRFKKIMEDPDNLEAVFSPTALKELNRILFTSGNLLIGFDRKERKFSRLAVDLNIENYISHDADQSRVKYYLRTYEVRNDLSSGAMSEVVREWVPTASYYLSNRVFPKSIRVGNKDVPVNPDFIVVDKRINRDNGEVWGVPDAFAAAPWAHIYSNYLKDGGKLFRALAAISYIVKARTEAQARTAGAKLQNGRVGQAAITGPDTQVQSMPRAGNVDLYEGRPLQAAVASALDVSVTGLASDPGMGGSYASEVALSVPEQMAALSRQEDFAEFFSRLFMVMGADDIVFNPRRLDVDPIQRQFQSLAVARQLGGINQKEFRERALELLDIDRIGTALPKPDEFTGSKASTLKAYIDKAINGDSQGGEDNDNGEAPDTAAPEQGKKGVAGSFDNNGNGARDDDRDAGTA